MKYINLILIIITLLVSCTAMESGPAIESDTISLTWKETIQVEYNPTTYQLGYNSSSNVYRVYDDRLSYWFTIKCSEKPATQGQILTADVSWTGKSKTINLRELKFEVTKTDDTGKVWLWNQANRISIVLKNQ